jgi:hypothetical protein
MLDSLMASWQASVLSRRGDGGQGAPAGADGRSEVEAWDFRNGWHGLREAGVPGRLDPGRPVRCMDQLYAQALAVAPMLRAHAVRWAAAAASARVDMPQLEGGDDAGASAGCQRELERNGIGGLLEWIRCGWIKEPARAWSKALVRYEGDPSRLLDVCRTRIVADSPAGARPRRGGPAASRVAAQLQGPAGTRASRSEVRAACARIIAGRRGLVVGADWGPTRRRLGVDSLRRQPPDLPRPSCSPQHKGAGTLLPHRSGGGGPGLGSAA